jgi:3-deoxy-manno-octulosonate cytidylyltransferase (CMP-KDO synthetase)
MKKVSQHQFTGIIPARYASTRFPGKPLELIGSKTMIRRVYEQAAKALPSVFVATDDTRIKEAVLAFGGKVIMTSHEHRSGSDRCSEAVHIIERETGNKIDVIINIQGDEPFIKPEQIRLLCQCFDDRNVEIATLIRKVETGEELFNVNQPKVVITVNGDALYFSRSTIPFLRGSEKEQWTYNHKYYKHLGIYGYTKRALMSITALKQGALEIAESLEQDRWLENGYKIRTAVTEWESIGIDTPEDLVKANELLKGTD